jgi:tRNA (adenine22-N1)-methyltransferase
MVEILAAEPEKVPPVVIVQANRDSRKLRRWALDTGFHLVREQMAPGRWVYEILTFHKNTSDDPAYQNVPTELALHFGPLLLKQAHPLLRAELRRREKGHKEHPRNQELRRIGAALGFMGK